jgi:hypothetical protein
MNDVVMRPAEVRIVQNRLQEEEMFVDTPRMRSATPAWPVDRSGEVTAPAGQLHRIESKR